MFCYQCEQHALGRCNVNKGVCGKDETTAILQDVLVYATRGLAAWLNVLYQHGESDRESERFVLDALFLTVTNVNFDANDIEKAIHHAVTLREKLRTRFHRHHQPIPSRLETGSAAWNPGLTREELLMQGRSLGIEARKESYGDDVTALQELLTYGLKGAAAYAHHAYVLGYEDEQIYRKFVQLLDRLNILNPSIDQLLQSSLECGELNLRVMELLDRAHTESYGHPEPTPVRITPVAGKAILVSGHDLRDLKLLLEQTEGKGINIYTHGEMLPCHAYPELKKHKHLVGHYGGAWQRQAKEFSEFPGAILMTTNCLQEPKPAYRDRIFTTGLVGWPGVPHIDENKDFSPVIKTALAAPGFLKTDEPEKTVLVGFGHHTVLSVADKIVQAVKEGKIRHFFLIGGCDGARPGRNYYTEFAQSVPQDCVILTLACGKFRFNTFDFGTIAGLPRLLDVGQCNDAYSAIQIAITLAKVFQCDVNQLPLSLILSWYEQKAVAILLTLLYLGIQNIRLGPTLPAFITPKILNVLVEQFKIQPIGTVQEDLAAILKK